MLKAYLGISVLLLASASYGATTTLTAPLSGANENPPNASPGTGVATVVYDSTAHTLSINVGFSGLLGATTAAHIHCCVAPPGNAGVATTVPTLPGFPLGVMAGQYAVTLDLTMPGSFNPAFIAANGGTVAGAEAALANGLANGMAYLNIHTTIFPGGEIRGFLQVRSAAPTLSLVGLGMLMMLLTLVGVRGLRRT